MELNYYTNIKYNTKQQGGTHTETLWLIKINNHINHNEGFNKSLKEDEEFLKKLSSEERWL